MCLCKVNFEIFPGIFSWLSVFPFPARILETSCCLDDGNFVCQDLCDRIGTFCDGCEVCGVFDLRKEIFDWARFIVCGLEFKVIRDEVCRGDGAVGLEKVK